MIIASLRRIVAFMYKFTYIPAHTHDRSRIFRHNPRHDRRPVSPRREDNCSSSRGERRRVHQARCHPAAVLYEKLFSVARSHSRYAAIILFTAGCTDVYTRLRAALGTYASARLKLRVSRDEIYTRRSAVCARGGVLRVRNAGQVFLKFRRGGVSDSIVAPNGQLTACPRTYLR